jgi:hypothetical protein
VKFYPFFDDILYRGDNMGFSTNGCRRIISETYHTFKAGVKKAVDVGGKPKFLLGYGAGLLAFDMACKYASTKLLPHLDLAKVELTQAISKTGIFQWINHANDLGADSFIFGDAQMVVSKYIAVFGALGMTYIATQKHPETASLSLKILRTSFFTVAAAGIGNWLYPVDFITLKNIGICNSADLFGLLAVGGFATSITYGFFSKIDSLFHKKV